jgi:5'(3')-deoxyribonucleotidase
MPIISMFYGMIIRMYLLDNKHHNLPHIHAKYAEYEASINIEDGRFLRVNYPESN